MDDIIFKEFFEEYLLLEGIIEVHKILITDTLVIFEGVIKKELLGEEDIYGVDIFVKYFLNGIRMAAQIRDSLDGLTEEAVYPTSIPLIELAFKDRNSKHTTLRTDTKKLCDLDWMETASGNDLFFLKNHRDKKAKRATKTVKVTSRKSSKDNGRDTADVELTK